MLACNREFYPLLSIVAVSFEAQVKPIVHFAYCAWMWVLHAIEQKGWNRGRWVGLPAGIGIHFWQ